MSDSLSFLLDLERVIKERTTADAASSYTAELFAAGTRRMAQKVGEEGVEVALAAAAGDRPELLEESADLLYHLLVLLRSADAGIGDVVGVLEARHR